MPGKGSMPVPKIPLGGKTRTELKREKRLQEAAAMKACYRQVDEREGLRCRITRAPVNPCAVTPEHRGVHHHVNYRSLGGGHTLENVILISQWVHEKIHAGQLRVSGDAEQRDPLGRLCGITVERLAESGWYVWKVC